MPACESKLASRRSRKATVVKTVFLSRPRSCGRMPSLVGDCGQVLRVLDWAITRICNLLFGATLCYPRELNSGCMWNRAVSCLAT